MSNIGVAERQTYDQQVRSKFLRVSNESATLGVHDRVTIAESNTDALTLTLPNVGEAAGKMFTITAPNGATNTVTVQDNDESMNWSDLSMDANNDQVVLYSDGLSWMVLLAT